ncbi:hypothetical protein DMH04_24280 [Kibdelosporangium aridum]|uniref:Uncharacterized protein n=1 Tax=Kibdelosporangium aridum TaxID=2030 RepID=A0A428Z6C7_KIBAR|nr:hypothetical protein [Kibdelosporangium aridum]RSM82746.1 hypothetical protein DMH04_24280 [Kibdelosporangium aridum]
MPADATDHRTLAAFCASLPELTRQAAGEGWQPELDEACEQLRAQQRPADEVLSELWAMLGIAQTTRGEGGLVRPLGRPAAPPPQGGYRCPQDRCARVADRRPGGPIPQCALFKQSCRFVTA